MVTARHHIAALLVLALASLSQGQTIHVTDQNIFDLNPSRDAISGLVGSQRIRANFWLDPSYTDPVDLTGQTLTLTIRSTTDDYQVSVINSATTAPPNTVWWVVPALTAGGYVLTASTTLEGLPDPIFWRNLTVTSAPSASLSLTNVNNITIDQSTSITNFIDQFVGINVLEPVVVSTNVSGTWTINLTTNNPVGIYVQVGTIDGVAFTVDDTNDVALAEVILLATTNALTWGTNITWVSATAPTPTASQYNRIYFEAWRGSVFGVYIGSNP